MGEDSLEYLVNLSSKDGAKIEKQQMAWEAIHCWEQLIGAKSDPSEQIWQQVGSYHRPTRASLPLWRRVVERKLFQPKLTFNLFLLQGEVLREVVLNGGDDRLWTNDSALTVDQQTKATFLATEFFRRNAVLGWNSLWIFDNLLASPPPPTWTNLRKMMRYWWTPSSPPPSAIWGFEVQDKLNNENRKTKREYLFSCKQSF